MGIFNKLSTFLFGDYVYDEEPQDYDMEPRAKAVANPVEINPTPQASLDRQLGRLLNLYRARNKDEGVLNEIIRYRQSIANFGYNEPMDEQDVLNIIESLKG